MKVVELILDLIWPRFCIGCGRWGAMICGKCVDKLELVCQKCPMCTRKSVNGLTHKKCVEELGVDGLSVCFDFKDEKVQSLIWKVKYSGEWSLLSELFALVNFNIPFEVDYLVPVPSSRGGYKERGYNQAKIIALLLSKLTGIPTVELVVKKRETSKLALIRSANEREELLRNAFDIKTTISLNYKRVLIVDDVFTSGATMREIGRMLKNKGVLKVYGWVLASG